MVPQAKLLLVSLLQGAGGLPGSGTSQNASANVAVGASPPTTQASVSNGTNQTGNTHGAVMSRGAEKESQGSHSVRPKLAAAPTELPAASTSSPSNYPTEPVALGSAGHKGVCILEALPPPASLMDWNASKYFNIEHNLSKNLEYTIARLIIAEN